MQRREFLGRAAAGGAARARGGVRPRQAGAEREQNVASAQGSAARRIPMAREEWLKRALEGCGWLAGRSQVLDRQDPNYGAMRSEYLEATREWRFYQATYQEPFWHTGQAVRTLLLAHQITGDARYLKHATIGGEYLIYAQDVDKTDARYYGFLFGKSAEAASTASQLEGLRALIDLYHATKDRKWRDRFKLGLDWVLKNLYRRKEGLFTNTFMPRAYTFAPPERSRPLIDDATLYVAYQEFNEPRYLESFRELADRLLRDEDPPGNWMKYQPCQPEAFGGLGQIHPRHGWWWGHPLLTAYDAFGDRKYLQAGARTAEWYIENSSLDGACYYHNTRNGRHLSFDFCTSATGCAVILWADLWKRTREEKYRAAIQRALGFLLRAQLSPQFPDPNLRGAFFEGLHPPDGTGRQRYYVRDLSTVFASRAILEVLQAFKEPQVFYQEF